VAALDDEIRERVGRLLDSLRGRLESELGSCQDELLRTAQDASATIAAEAAQHATAEARREAEQQLTEVREAAARHIDEQRTRLTADIEAVQRRFDESQRQIENSQKESSSAREQIENLTGELEEARKQLDATRDDVEATLRDIQASRRDIEASRREVETARMEVNRLMGELRNCDERSVQTRRLPDAVRVLDEAATVAEVLETLAVWAGREAGRAAVFLVKGSRLRGWRTVGFDFPSDGPRLDIDLGESGPMAEAVQTGKGVCPRAHASTPEFARTDEAREPGAWPVSVGGAVVAVLYADGPVADKSEEPYWPAFLDVLARHAGRVLEAITVRQAAGLMTGTATSLAPHSRVSSVSRQSTGSIQ
jgi:hypothetical protein